MDELLEDGMLPPATANEQMMRQFARQRAGRQQLETPQQALDLGAGLLGMVPVVGDAMGLAADVNRYREDPESRTALNFGLTGLGLLPLIPGMTAFKKGGKEPMLRRMAEYEGRMFSGGAYSDARYRSRMLAKDAPIKGVIELARKNYNELRAQAGLPPVTDWSVRPTETGEQLLRKLLDE